VKEKALKDLAIATCNMSLPVMVALLGRIHCRLQENDEMEDVAEHIGEALSLLMDRHCLHAIDIPPSDRAH
jgi:hypothetical protein